MLLPVGGLGRSCRKSTCTFARRVRRACCGGAEAPQERVRAVEILSEFRFRRTLGARRVANVGPMGNLKTRLRPARKTVRCICSLSLSCTSKKNQFDGFMHETVVCGRANENGCRLIAIDNITFFSFFHTT